MTLPKIQELPTESLFGWSHETLETLKSTICKGLPTDQFEMFCTVCKQTGLNPFLKQIYPVRRGYDITIQTGIDGFRLIADRTGNYAPGKETIFTYGPSGELICATSYIKKRTSDGVWHELSASAYFDEYCQRTKDGSPTQFWNRMKHTMLSKCAEALAIRKAFPNDFTKLYIKEEMEQATVADEMPKMVSEPQKLENHLNAQTDYESLNGKPTIQELGDSKKPHELKIENPKIIQEPISENQLKELENLLEMCTDEFKKKMLDSIKKPLKELPQFLFIRFKKAVVSEMANNSLNILHAKRQQEIQNSGEPDLF